jgi:hypothetical protein
MPKTIVKVPDLATKYELKELQPRTYWVRLIHLTAKRLKNMGAPLQLSSVACLEKL